MQTDGKRPNKQPLDGKIREVLTVLRHALGELYGDRLCGLYLFGSYARGEATPESDVDILVVLGSIADYGRERDRISFLTAPLALETELGISTVLMSEADWRGADGPFYLNVREDAVAA